MSNGLACSYDTSTQLLTISNPMTYNTQGPLTLSATVSGFANPYSGKPITGYYMLTKDQNGGIMDSSLANSAIKLSV